LDDGVTFTSITSERIKEDSNYEGIRLKIDAILGQARKRLQIDIGFGDKIVLGVKLMEFPTLLEEKPPKLKVYSIESIISEKFEAMLKLAMANNRMKDFYDVYKLSLSHDFQGSRLKKAIEYTFQRRNTPLVDNPLFVQNFTTINKGSSNGLRFFKGESVKWFSRIKYKCSKLEKSYLWL